MSRWCDDSALVDTSRMGISHSSLKRVSTGPAFGSESRKIKYYENSKSLSTFFRAVSLTEPTKKVACLRRTRTSSEEEKRKERKKKKVQIVFIFISQFSRFSPQHISLSEMIISGKIEAKWSSRFAEFSSLICVCFCCCVRIFTRGKLNSLWENLWRWEKLFFL